MKRQHVNYLVVGLVSIALFGLLGVVLVKITGRSGPTDEYYIHYTSVAGLGYGTPVFYEGYLIGQVDTITPERGADGTSFRVDVSVQRDWTIPADSLATISTGLLSGVAIDIREGSSTETLTPGSEIRAQDGVGFMAALNDLANDMRELSASHIRPMVERLSNRIDSLTSGLDEDVPSLLDDVRHVVERLDRSAAHLEEILAEDNRNSVGITVDNLREVSEKLVAMTDDLVVTGAEVRSMVEKNRPGVDASVDNMRVSLETLTERLDGVGYQLESASRNLNEFTRAIRNNPGLLLSSQPRDETEELP